MSIIVGSPQGDVLYGSDETQEEAKKSICILKLVASFGAMMNQISPFEIIVGETAITACPCRLSNGKLLFIMLITYGKRLTRTLGANIFYLSMIFPYFFEGRLEAYSQILEERFAKMLKNNTLGQMLSDEVELDSNDDEIYQLFTSIEERLFRPVYGFIDPSTGEGGVFSRLLMPLMPKNMEWTKMNLMRSEIFLKPTKFPDSAAKANVKLLSLFSSYSTDEDMWHRVLEILYDTIINSSSPQAYIDTSGEDLMLRFNALTSRASAMTRVVSVEDSSCPLLCHSSLIVTEIPLRRSYSCAEESRGAGILLNGPLSNDFDSTINFTDSQPSLVLTTRVPKVWLTPTQSSLTPTSVVLNLSEDLQYSSVSVPSTTSPVTLHIARQEVLPLWIIEAWQAALLRLNRAFYFPEVFQGEPNFSSLDWLTPERLATIFPSNPATIAEVNDSVTGTEGCAVGSGCDSDGDGNGSDTRGCITCKSTTKGDRHLSDMAAAAAGGPNLQPFAQGRSDKICVEKENSTKEDEVRAFVDGIDNNDTADNDRSGIGGVSITGAAGGGRRGTEVCGSLSEEKSDLPLALPTPHGNRIDGQESRVQSNSAASAASASTTTIAAANFTAAASGDATATSDAATAPTDPADSALDSETRVSAESLDGIAQYPLEPQPRPPDAPKKIGIPRPGRHWVAESTA